MIENVDDRASGQVDFIAYVNGVDTDYRYDSRLRRTGLGTHRTAGQLPSAPTGPVTHAPC